jgi:hypothetical protein
MPHDDRHRSGDKQKADLQQAVRAAIAAAVAEKKDSPTTPPTTAQPARKRAPVRRIIR